MKLLAQYYRIDRVVGINIHMGAGEEAAVIDACVLTATGDKLVFENKLSGLRSITELSKKLSAKLPVAVNLTGRGVLTKQLGEVSEINRQNFSLILPNADPGDFYIQHFSSGEQSFVSLIRCTEADRWLEALRVGGFVPLLISLGPFVVEQIVPQLNNYGEALCFNGHVVERNDQHLWTKYHYHAGSVSQFPFKADSEPLHENLLLPYSAGFQLILADRILPVAAEVPVLTAKLTTRLGWNRLRVHFALLVSVIFVLLLVNYLALSYLRDRNTALLALVSTSNTSAADITSLNEQVQNKEMLLKDLGWDGYLNKGAYVSQLAQVMPREIMLIEMSIDPVDMAASRNNKKITFIKRQIRILGTCPVILPVNEWMARMKTYKWVKQVQMENYGFDNELGTGSFVIVIDY
jgi:hypothetical protein